MVNGIASGKQIRQPFSFSFLVERVKIFKVGQMAFISNDIAETVGTVLHSYF